jgi:hypothetical protein
VDRVTYLKPSNLSSLKNSSCQTLIISSFCLAAQVPNWRTDIEPALRGRRFWNCYGVNGSKGTVTAETHYMIVRLRAVVINFIDNHIIVELLSVRYCVVARTGISNYLFVSE